VTTIVGSREKCGFRHWSSWFGLLLDRSVLVGHNWPTAV